MESHFRMHTQVETSSLAKQARLKSWELSYRDKSTLNEANGMFLSGNQVCNQTFPCFALTELYKNETGGMIL